MSVFGVPLWALALAAAALAPFVVRALADVIAARARARTEALVSRLHDRDRDAP